MKTKGEVALLQSESSAAFRIPPRYLNSVTWVRELARPYLRGYRPLRANQDGLHGFWFALRGQPTDRTECGFFVGYLADSQAWPLLSAEPPECLVFAYVRPVGGHAHQRLVGAPDGLVHRTFEYIRWLTHRPPRFQFFGDQLPALIRHRSMREWPPEKYQHLSRNFFIETLAWLVRSGLVRRLAAEATIPQPAKRKRSPVASRKAASSVKRFGPRQPSC
ncbi:MAG: hypothetical protein ACRD5G_09270 [Candidatus Acidiferrales bacterium]